MNEKPKTRSMVEIHGSYPIHYGDEPIFSKNLSESTKEEQIEYLMTCVRVNGERHLAEKGELELNLKTQKDLNNHLSKKILSLKDKLKLLRDEL